mgnify:CR=1 FL=1
MPAKTIQIPRSNVLCSHTAPTIKPARGNATDSPSWVSHTSILASFRVISSFLHFGINYTLRNDFRQSFLDGILSHLNSILWKNRPGLSRSGLIFWIINYLFVIKSRQSFAVLFKSSILMHSSVVCTFVIPTPRTTPFTPLRAITLRSEPPPPLAV